MALTSDTARKGEVRDRMKQPAAAQSITYTLNLTITRAVQLFDLEATLAETAEWMTSREARRELEREVLQALRKFDGDCDVEVMEHAVIAQGERQ